MPCLVDDLWYLDASFGLKYEAFLALSPMSPDSPQGVVCHPRISLTWPSRNTIDPTKHTTAVASPSRKPRRVGNYSPQTRRQRILRFHEKRKQRQLKYNQLTDDGDDEAQSTVLPSPLWVPVLPDGDDDEECTVDDTFQELCLPDECHDDANPDEDDLFVEL
ncbi:hypothetical protein ACHHYP_20763 [Achlya hypogyna]|uniref:Uncharacterized protein n=1 Tax=Achlya hypogyna TaxID=1202772 RepID=A0A1V9YBB2_ACHHY|nr:hypothetical protein ACHHYP_20763 [Achlya hypogyna]